MTSLLSTLYSWSFPLAFWASLSVISPPVASEWSIFRLQRSRLPLQLYLSLCVHLSSIMNAFWSSYIEYWMSLLCNYTVRAAVSMKDHRQLNFRFMSFVECEFWLAIGNIQEPLPVVWSSLSYCPPWFLIMDQWRPYKSFCHAYNGSHTNCCTSQAPTPWIQKSCSSNSSSVLQSDEWPHLLGSSHCQYSQGPLLLHACHMASQSVPVPETNLS